MRLQILALRRVRCTSEEPVVDPSRIGSVVVWLVLLLLVSCQSGPMPSEDNSTNYFDHAGRDDVLTGGVKMIPIEANGKQFKVWTKRRGNNPSIKLLLLHGGPGMTHEYFEVFDSYLPASGIEYYYYDQLGSKRSDNPGDTSYWNIPRFVEEVEQVRQALGLHRDNFYLLGHSWGGILGVEYALKYQEHLKGLIISNMMMSIPDYVAYAQEVLGPALGEEILAKIKAFEAEQDYGNPDYLELITSNYYPRHVLRMPMDEWPEPITRSMGNGNMQVYIYMQGPSEFGITDDATLRPWTRMQDLNQITVPTLSIGGQHDTMDPEHMKQIAKMFQNGSSLHCPNGSHFSFYDDREVYFAGLIKWMEEVDGEG